MSAEFSRWEIGNQPQRNSGANGGVGSLADGRSGTSRNLRAQDVEWYEKFSRWEIGNQPQRIRSCGRSGRKFSRWEIGNQPQRDG